MGFANALTHTGENSLTVMTNVSINQPTAAVTVSWNINTGYAIVNSDILIGGSNITPSRVSRIAVTTGALTVSGSVTYASNTNAANEVISLTTGTITFNSALTLSSGTLSATGAGTMNFNGGFTFGGANTPALSTVAATNINVGGNLTAGTTALTFNATSNVTFTNASIITPTAPVTFGNIQINPGVLVTLAGSVTVAGNLTNNGGALSGGANAVTFTGATKTIGGTANTDLPTVVIASGASYTINTNASCAALTFAASSVASSLTQAASIVLTVYGDVTVNQPTTGVTTSWSINAGAAVVNGSVIIGGTDLTSSRVAQIAVTTGSLVVMGSVTYASNASAATEVISLSSTGTITFNSALTLSSGTLSTTWTGAINFNGGLTFGGSNNPVFTTAAGSGLNVGGNLTVSTTALTLNSGSNAIFTNTSTITPNASISFGNVQINSGVIVTLAGSVTVVGNWTNNGGTFNGGSNTVTFAGAARTIGGIASTGFPAMVVAPGATYTMNNDNTCASLTFAASSAASSLTQAASIELTVNGDVTVNQPTAGVTTSWNINAGIVVVNGDVLIGGTDPTPSRVAQITVSTGSLTALGSVIYASNASAATEVISVSSTGTLTFNNALTLSSGMLSATSTGTINFNGGLTLGGANMPVLSTASGANLNVGGDLIVSTAALTFHPGSTAIFTNASTITPTTPITFGNVQINSGVLVTLAGNITVAGNWTNNGGTLNGGANVVTLTGATKTIGGSANADLPAVVMASGASYTINTSTTCSVLTFATSSAASSLTQAAPLTVNGNVTINQPTAGVTTSWNINTGAAVVNGDISIGGSNTTASRVAQIAVTTGSLTIMGSVTYASNATAATEVITVSTGTITFNSALTLGSGKLSVTGAGPINFNGGLAFGGINTPVLSTASGANLNVGGDFAVNTTALTFNAGSNAIFTNPSTITPTAPITFGNFQINPGVNVTLAGSIAVAGNWTNNGDSFSGGANTVTFTGTTKTIGGTTGTDLPAVVIASGASYTMNTNTICTALTFTASSAASSLTQAASLTVNGNVTVNQPTAGVTTSWNINVGSAVVTGDVLLGGTNPAPSRIAQIAVTSGSFTVLGSVMYTPNASAATEVISVTTGTITFNNALTLGSGKLSVTGAGTINFNGGLTFGGINAPVLSTASGANLNVGGDFAVSTTALTLNAGSNAVFTNASTTTPNAPITFGNVQINPGVIVTLAGSVAVAGNWTNNGGSFNGGANTVTFTGATKTIGGTAGTDFTVVVIGSGASYTMNTNTTCAGLTFTASSAASSLIQAAAVVFTINGNVTVSQPTAGVTTSWSINAGVAVVNGDILIGGADLTPSRVAQIAVTSGLLTVMGSATYASNASPATEVISVTTGTITFNNGLTLSSGRLSATGAGTINFNDGLTFGGINTPVLSTVSGSTLNVGGNLTVSTTALTFSNGCTVVFTNASTITPNAPITFGNVQINPGVTAMLGGPITVNGNFTLQLNSAFDRQNFSLALKGNLTTNGTFLPSTGALKLIGSSGQTISGLVAPSFNSLTVDNSSPAGVTLGEDVIVNDTLTLASGTFSLGTYTLTLNGAIVRSTGTLIGGISSSISIGGTGPGTTLPAVNVNNLTLNRPNGISLGGVLTVNGTLSLTRGPLSIGANALTLNGGVSVSGGSLIGGTSSNITIGGTGVSTALPGVLLNNLTLNRSSGISLLGDVTINGVLGFSTGNIATGVSRVIINTTGSVVRASGYVVGNLQKNVSSGSNVARVFEIGDAGAYTPVELMFDNVLVSGNLLASTTSGDHPNISTSGVNSSRGVNRYWTLKEEGLTFSSYNAKFNFVSGDVDPGANTNNFFAQTFELSTWGSTTLGARAATSIQVSGLTSCSDFVIGEIIGYTIAASAGTGGTINPSGVVGVLDGSNQQFTISPNPGYHLANLLIDGVHKDSTTSYTFTEVRGNHTIDALFAINTYTILATAGPGGIINRPGTVIVNHGADTTFQIIPNAGFFIGDVLVDSASVGKKTTYTFSNVTTNHTISAGFYPNTAPTAPGLLAPINGDTLRIYAASQPVSFMWHRSLDVDATDTLRYSIHILGPGLDTTVAGMIDTTVSLDIMPRLQQASMHTWSVAVTDGFSTVAAPDTFLFRTSTIITDVQHGPQDLPREYALRQNFPNPFNPSTEIRYELPTASRVHLSVYNVLGEEIEVLLNVEQGVGYHSVHWRPTIASGMYFCRLQAVSLEDPSQSTQLVRKMLLVK